METLKISIYLNGQFIRVIWGDFKSKNQALKWTLDIYKDIGIILNPKEIIIINPLA